MYHTIEIHIWLVIQIAYNCAYLFLDVHANLIQMEMKILSVNR